MSPRFCLLAVLACSLWLLRGTPVRSYEQQLTSTLYASGYTVRAANGTFIDRRNIFEEVYLGGWNIIPGSDEPSYRGPRLSIEIDLRFGGDYGVNNSEMSSANLDRYVPGLQAMYLEPVFAYVELQGVAKDHLDMRLGRQIRSDAAGYGAFDGAELALHWPFGVRVDGFIGAEVQGARPLGYDNLALDGVDNAGRDELDEAYFKSLVDASPTMLLGAEVSMTPNRMLDAALAVRQAGYGKRLQQQTVAARLAVGNERLRGLGKVVANPFLDRYDNLGGALREGTLVTEALLEVTAAVRTNAWLSLSYELYRPVFALDSIFNLFGQVGRRDATVRFEHRPNRKTQWASWSFMRFADDKNIDEAAEQQQLVVGGGGGAGVNVDTFSRSLSTRMVFDTELGATRLGLEHELGHRYFDDRLWLSLRSSLWHISDALYGASKNIAGYVLSARHQFSKKALAVFEFENYYGDDTPRFVLTALLQLDVWR